MVKDVYFNQITEYLLWMIAAGIVMEVVVVVLF